MISRDERHTHDLAQQLAEAKATIAALLSGQIDVLDDVMIEEASWKLKTLGDLETVNEKEMAVGLGIEYPGSF